MSRAMAVYVLSVLYTVFLIFALFTYLVIFGEPSFLKLVPNYNSLSISLSSLKNIKLHILTDSQENRNTCTETHSFLKT